MFASNLVFIHKHQTATGIIIIHTHPYDLSTDPEDTKHHRSSSEIYLWDVVLYGTYLQPPFAQVDFFLNPLTETGQPIILASPSFNDFRGLADLRAPPKLPQPNLLN